jgi:hypothetical protein
MAKGLQAGTASCHVPEDALVAAAQDLSSACVDHGRGGQ